MSGTEKAKGMVELDVGSEEKEDEASPLGAELGSALAQEVRRDRAAIPRSNRFVFFFIVGESGVRRTPPPRS